MSESLRGRRSEEMTQSNAFSPQGSEVLFESQRGRMEGEKKLVLLSFEEEGIGGA